MFTPSPDLIALTRAQMGILLQMGIATGAVYVAEMGQIQELFAYPEQHHLLPPLPTLNSGSLLYQGMMVLPLLYENTLLGFLTLDRGGGEWTEHELAVIRKVVTTLTIALAQEQRQQQLYQQQQDFLARLLHQLRNPLTAIRTFAQLLWRRLGGDQGNQVLAEHILAEVAHLQDLLKLAETPQPVLLGGTSEVKFLPAGNLFLSPVEIQPILHQIARNAEAIAQEKGLQFSLDVPQSIPPVTANPEALREVVSNLVDNALKYTSAGQITLAVEVQPPHVAISVTDTGVGIPACDLDQIFTPHFRSAQTADTTAGQGLGLAIVADLVHKMGGTIAVTSEVGQGSQFKLTLPIADVENCSSR
ncbi:MAG: ATP-binding protein [Pseudanabaenaceae cyanobacterium]